MDDFLSEDHDKDIQDEIGNLLVEVANQFHIALRSDGFAAAKTYLSKALENRDLSTRAAAKRSRLQQA